MSTKNITRYLGSIFLLLSLTITQNAYAEGFDLFKPNDDNWLIKNIFIPLFYPDTSPFSPISGVFLAGILAFGGVLAGYTMLAGTLNTAHDGEMLGKKWSSLWLPVRTTLGVSMIMPIKGGFCAIQLIVVWLAVQGVGLADQTWNAFVENPLKGSVLPQPVIDRQISTLYQSAVSGYACIAAIKKDQGENEADGKSAGIIDKLLNITKEEWNPGVTTSTTSGTNNGKKLVIEFGNKNREASRNACGSIIYDMYATSDKVIANAPQAALDLVDLNKIQRSLIPVHVTALSALLARASDVGNRIANDDDSINADYIANDMKVAGEAYKVAIALAANTAYQDSISKDTVESLKKDGFVSAGAWFIRIAMAQSAVNNVVNNVPIGTGVTGSMLEESTSWFGGSDKTDYPSVDKIKKKVKTYFAKANMLNNNSASGAGAGTEGDQSLLDKLMAVFSPSELAALFTAQAFTANPVVAIINIGLSLINFALVTYGVMTTVVLGIGTAANVIPGGVISATTLVTPLVTGLLFALFWAGIRMAYVIAWKPFIVWFGAIIGWLVLVVESMFAAPLWMVAHLAPDQDGVVGKMGQGYMLILSLILRPVLMVIGFVVALSLMTPCLMLINAFIAFTGDTIGVGAAAFIGKIVMITIYLKVVEETMNKLFGLIHSIPDSILQWIGGGLSRSMGDYANGIEGGSSHTTEKIGGGSKQAVMSMSSASTRGVQRAQELRERNEENTMNAANGHDGGGSGNDKSSDNAPKTRSAGNTDTPE
ncbi:hypothetical protein EU237_23065 [Salmonella enterica subsp. enterica serovar Schwarzengrund]|nr:hypothetical protein [Salmonella enterica subsp. enterica serovar Schwarzengrund]